VFALFSPFTEELFCSGVYFFHFWQAKKNRSAYEKQAGFGLETPSRSVCFFERYLAAWGGTF
jgi:hypothetical protein